MEKQVRRSVVCVFILITICIFVENFVGIRFYELSLRALDDIAFQSSLNNFFSRKHILDLLFMNDFGYGWIYWFPIVVITFPAYLLKEATGVEWLIIVLPRMLSLLFAIGSTIILYRLIKLYTKSYWIQNFSLFLMPLFPAGAYFAGRFGTVNQVAFFSLLSIFLIVKEDNIPRRTIRHCLFAFAVALATKVSAVVVFPLIMLLILNKLEFKLNKGNIKLLLQEGCLSFIVFVFLCSPIIALMPLSPERAKDSIAILVSYVTSNQHPTDILNNLKIFTGFSMYKIQFLILYAGLFIAAVIEERRGNKEFLCYWLGLTIGILYLCITIPTGGIYIWMYATAITGILPLGLLGIEKLFKNFRFKGVLVPIFCIGICLLQLGFSIESIHVRAANNPFRYFQSFEEGKELLKNIISIKNAVLESTKDMESISCAIDYQGPVAILSPIANDNVASEITIWDNLGEYENIAWNVVILYKGSRGFLEENKFIEEITILDEEQKNIAIRDRQKRASLLQEKQKLIYEDDDFYVFINP